MTLQVSTGKAKEIGSKRCAPTAVPSSGPFGSLALCGEYRTIICGYVGLCIYAYYIYIYVYCGNGKENGNYYSLISCSEPSFAAQIGLCSSFHARFHPRTTVILINVLI